MHPTQHRARPRLTAASALFVALFSAASQGQNLPTRPQLVGYEPVGWNIAYATDLRDEVFLSPPFGDAKGTGLGEKYGRVFCVAPRTFGIFAGAVGARLVDAQAGQNVGAFDTASDAVVNEEQVYADKSRVFLIGVFDAWIWNRQSGRLVKHCTLRRVNEEEVALTTTFYAPRAGVIIQAMGPELRTWSAKTGQLLHVAPHLLANFDSEYGEAKDASHVVFSPDARECFYNTTIYTSQPDPTSDENEPRDGPPGPTHVASCQSGQTLWTINPRYTLKFGGDGQTVLAQREKSSVVEVRAALTGKRLYRVNIRPNCTFLGSSRDGRTLYTHDGEGRVWKQGLG